MNHGDRREPIFKDEADRRRFLATLGEACLKTGWQVHAYCLMPNHFHLVVETPRASLVAGMNWLSTEQQAQGLIRQELDQLGWDEAELKRQPKGARRKVRIARRLRAETTMTLGWIAERLRMGSASMVTHCLRQER
jgi:REP element-mobilizing transposase RayT